MIDGGGRLVDLAAAPGAQVRLRPDDADGLQGALDAAPWVSWVQFPSQASSASPAAGVSPPERAWTCVRGAYSGPVAEHALA